MEITYTEKNGILYPDLEIPQHPHYKIGKYGDLHLAFLKEHRRGTYSHLLTTCKLNDRLHQIDLLAHEMLNNIIDRLATERGVNEDLKAKNALLWVQEMNNCKSAAEEIVLREVIYQ